MEIIPHNKPSIGQEEITAVKNILESGWLAQGVQVENFENKFCEYLGNPEGAAVALSSGTAALYLVLISLGAAEGDEVIMPSYVCSALLNSVYLARATPVLVDIDQNDLNISFEETAKKITPRTKAIIVPHIFGMPAQIKKFMELGLPVIEDCAQALGSRIDGQAVGNFGCASIFSFYASKLITTGYGGMVFSKDKEFINKVRDYREFDCRHDYKPRFNFQMADFQAAIGISQLGKLPLFLEIRKKIAARYQEALPAEIVWPFESGSREPNYYRFLVRARHPQELKKFMEGKGIKTILPIENYELLNRYLNLAPGDFPASEQAASLMLSLPIYPSLSEDAVERIAAAANEYFSNFKNYGKL